MSRLADHMPHLLALLVKLPTHEAEKICAEMARATSQVRGEAFGEAAV